MQTRILAALALGMLLAADAPKDKDTESTGKDVKALQGTWWAIKIEESGKALQGEDVVKFSLIIKDDTYTLKAGEDEVEHGTFKLDTAQKPKAMDLKIASGEDKGKHQHAIYELDRNRLTLCYAKPGEPRPKKLSPPKDGGLFVFEKAK
jgi:uncharacterized protein (TIGR03067 family)